MTATTDGPRRPATVPSSRWPILRRSLLDRRRSSTGWGVGIGIYVGLIVVFWPSIRGSSEITEAIENYPDVMKEFFGGAAAFDYSRPGGFLNTQLFSLVLPLLIAIFAIGYGASALAADPQRGTLDLELSLPLRRSRILVEKTAALGACVIALGLLSAVVIVVVGAFVDLDLAPEKIAAACIGAALVALVHGLVALTVGAGTGNRALSLGVATAAFVAGYLVEAVSGLVDAVRPLRWLSALHHANGTVPIEHGFPVFHDLLLVGACALLAVVAVQLFDHRDVAS